MPASHMPLPPLSCPVSSVTSVSRWFPNPENTTERPRTQREILAPQVSPLRGLVLERAPVPWAYAHGSKNAAPDGAGTAVSGRIHKKWDGVAGQARRPILRLPDVFAPNEAAAQSRALSSIRCPSGSATTAWPSVRETTFPPHSATRDKITASDGT